VNKPAGTGNVHGNGVINMSKVCEICGKKPVAGRNVSHSHRVTNRVFRPNVQKITINDNGTVRRANVCTKCMKAGKVERA
jgi:large subunit ribosomal protein L28